ncbi:MAG: cysteine--tRNA ligase [Pseudomonadota bacterium]
MTEITLINSATRRKERFEPIDPMDVRMYVCGPTVYDRAHLGNARPVVVFDLLYRLLRHVYGPDHVTYVRNFTDVDDKINARAAATGRSIREITNETIDWFHEDMGALGILTPDHEPRATEYINEMIEMIADLIAKDHAYAAEGHVLFAVDSYNAYGALSGRSVKDMIAGARVEVAPYKQDPIDFVLWKPSSGEEPGWESPWGVGRPGWHIECSAMARQLLGESFDIHGGGNDLTFPHHENEIAQSRCACPEGDFARVWLHNEMLQVEGKKMSKSLGNFFTVRDLLDRGVPGEVIRFVFLSTHYRKPMDWTDAKAAEAERVLRKWYAQVEGVVPGELPEKVVAALADDLNSAGALAELHRLSGDGDVAGLRGGLELMGLIDEALPHWVAPEKVDPMVSKRIDLLIDARARARDAKEFAKADAIRGFLQMAGVEIEDGEVTSWKTGYEQEPFGWLAVAVPAKDGKTKISFGELLDFASERGLEVVKEKKGRWAQVSLKGEPSGLQLKFIELAEAEANP